MITTTNNEQVSYLEGAASPGKACSQYVGVGNDEKCQKDP